MNLIERRRKLIIFLTLCLVVFGVFIFIATREGKTKAYGENDACPMANCGGSLQYNTKIVATCTSTGQTIYQCDTCGTFFRNTIQALGHAPGATATCTAAQTCTRQGCGAVITVALGHSYTTDATKWTYTQAGGNHIVSKPCTRTGCTVSQSTQEGHTYSSEATCTEAKKCSKCGFQMTGVLGHTGGTHANGGVCTRNGCNTKYQTHEKSTTWSNLTQPASDGHYMKCTQEGCTSVYKVEHTWEGYKKVSDTQHARKCTICSMSGGNENCSWEYVSLSNLLHTKKCKTCDNKLTGQHSYDNITKTNLNGTEIAHNVIKKCVCGFETTEPENHDFGDWYQSSPVTHTKKCKGCNYLYTKNHTGTWTRKDSTTHTQTCEICGVLTQSHITGSRVKNWNSTTHTTVCSVCNGDYPQAHTLDANGKCTFLNCGWGGGSGGGGRWRRKHLLTYIYSSRK